MTPDRYAHIKRIFLGACALSTDERPRYVAEACGDDEELREEVESLLRCGEASTDDDFPIGGRRAWAPPETEPED